ncbi:right-handed parallel beta-helix repeat-containing protein [Mucilaginibacter sp. SMC90]|uniref:right-handed parallel beta-helix repeat-containing protein n=1 Tax=Mucilaginibacter sp. SMC90 TaxID=2929803 RepID=UPI001FB464C1|nr:right-handed parallel beta-helix repeat-containing protein [Mucilaginibacter sp. SMC90]UOE48189.1 right-handed parallel beta-helix repeat-containing protein [Mucilaginibacter sp. SMC90]
MKSSPLLIYYLVLIFCLPQVASSKTIYYVSNDGSDSNVGTSAVKPFKTIDKVNSLTLNPGDVIYFKKGDIFEGQLEIRQSGTSTMPIIIDSYGTGKNAVLEAAIDVKKWTNLKGNIWQADFSSSADSVTTLFINSGSMPLGRYPNLSAVNHGYLTIKSHNGKVSIESGSPINNNWEGAQLVDRAAQWLFDKSTIVSQTGNTFTVTGKTADIKDNWGFFIQNHLSALDQNGEWCFDRGSHKISVFYTNGNINNQNIKASFYQHNILLGKSNYITIQNLTFRGSLTSAVYLNSCTNIQIQKSNFLYSGVDAIDAIGGSQVTIDNNNISDSYGNAINVNGTENLVLTNNVIKNTGLIPGRGRRGNGQNIAITYSSINGPALIKQNIIDSTGYNGIDFRSSNVTIQNNVISNFNLVKGDGGGIYTWNRLKNFNYVNQKIISNIILKASGSDYGTYNIPTGACGIYLDDCSQNIEVTGNTIAHCKSAGIYLHGTNNVVVQGNTSFDNGEQVLIFYSNCDDMHDNSISNNIFFSNNVTQPVARYETRKTDLANYGTFSNNYYYRKRDSLSSIIIGYDLNRRSGKHFVSLNEWKQLFNKDVNSHSGDRRTIKAQGSKTQQFAANLSSSLVKINAINLSSSNITPGDKFSYQNQSYPFNPTKNKTYLLSFDAVSSGNNKVVFCYFADNGDTDNPDMRLGKNKVSVSLSKDIQHFSLPISSGNKTYNKVIFSTLNDGEKITITNLDIKEDNAAQDDSSQQDDSKARFEYNSTAANKTINLGNSQYKDLKNNVYRGSLILKPFESVVLLPADNGN